MLYNNESYEYRVDSITGDFEETFPTDTTEYTELNEAKEALAKLEDALNSLEDIKHDIQNDLEYVEDAEKEYDRLYTELEDRIGELEEEEEKRFEVGDQVMWMGENHEVIDKEGDIVVLKKYIVHMGYVWKVVDVKHNDLRKVSND